jgi:hypothetical protein
VPLFVANLFAGGAEMEQRLALIREGGLEKKQEEPGNQQPGVQQNVTGCNRNVTGGQIINP